MSISLKQGSKCACVKTKEVQEKAGTEPGAYRESREGWGEYG